MAKPTCCVYCIYVLTLFLETIEQGPEALQSKPETQAKIKLFPDPSKSSGKSESSKESNQEVLASKTPPSFVLETPEPSIEVIL